MPTAKRAKGAAKAAPKGAAKAAPKRVAKPKAPSNEPKARVVNTDFPVFQKSLIHTRCRQWYNLAYKLTNYFSGYIGQKTRWMEENNYKPGTFLRTGGWEARLRKLLYSIDDHYAKMRVKSDYTEADLKKWEKYGELIVKITEENHPGWCDEGPKNIAEAVKLLKRTPVSQRILMQLDEMVCPPMLPSGIPVNNLRVSVHDMEGNLIIDGVELTRMQIGG